MSTEFTFVPPPEAPVFYPTHEEFSDPLEYLAKIRHIGDKTGICKIIPPKTWNPPFAVNMKEFSFTPRIQRLYELEANSRIKLNFISSLYKFNRLQGGDKIRVPSVSGRFLDLHGLHKQVATLGGYDNVCEKQLWSAVAEGLGYQPRQASIIKSNYEKLLLAFDRVVYHSTEAKKALRRTRESATAPKRYRSTRSQNEERIDYSTSKELRNLRFYGAGPKAVVPGINQETGNAPSNYYSALRILDSATSDRTDVNIDEYSCRICHSGDDEAHLLVCNNMDCQACYHMSCLNPRLSSVPKYAWNCPDCVRNICTAPPEIYGFPQSNKTYSLHEFGVMADEFKSSYFNRPCTDVPCSEVEYEFWRILQEYNDDVVVEYGADIHSSAQGSGFPTEERLKNLVGTAKQLQEAKFYAENPWNLNILPLLDRSVLRFIKGNIDGMKIPWCYVGMVFSSFCWHIEDHWSGSINFIHWGEPKTWYGVSHLYADDFERAMRKHAPELFEQAPDLLHHITTNMNPNILQAEGVPIYRTDQHCGEFVVTFPRAYHAGFNQGFNFAEAVNFCLPDWLPIGRACIDHYAEMKRYCVFSNDELLCTLAEVAVGRLEPDQIISITNPIPTRPDPTNSHSSSTTTKSRLPTGCSTAGLDISAVASVREEFLILLQRESELRDAARNYGITNWIKVRFDQMPDDERVCDVCMTTLFLSGVTCACNPQSGTDSTNPKRGARKRKILGESTTTTAQTVDNDGHPPSYMVCLKHMRDLCSSCKPSSLVVKYHYTLDELKDLEHDLSNRLGDFYTWRDSLSRLIGSGVKLNSIEIDENKSAKSNNPSSKIPTIKPEPHDSVATQDAGKTTMTIAELQSKLDYGHKCGYHSDDMYNDAKSFLDRGKRLVDVCTLLKAVISNSDVKSIPNSIKKLGPDSRPNLVQFPIRRPATFSVANSIVNPTKITNHGFVVLQHEVDITCPRESDLNRLIEACELHHPLDLFQEPDVQFIKGFISRIGEWRHEALDVVGTMCQLILTTNTRSLTTVLPSTSSPTKISAHLDELPSASDEEKALLLVTHLLDDMRNEFPRAAEFIPEWNSIDLLRCALKWLCIYEHQINSTKSSTFHWTLPRLRQYLAVGESIVDRFGSSSACGPKTLLKSSLAKVLTCRELSCLESAMGPIERLLRARMHSSLGQLTQQSVQIDSVIDMIIKLLASSNHNTVDYSPLANYMEQLEKFHIHHLVAKPSSNHDQPSELYDENSLLHLLDSQYVIPMDDIHQLCPILGERVKHFLGFPDKKSLPLIKRPKFMDAQALFHLGCLISNDSSGVTIKTAIQSDDFSEDLGRLKTWMSTSSAVVDQCVSEYRDSLPVMDTTDDKILLKALLPAFLTEKESADALNQFVDAYSESVDKALVTYDQLAKKCEELIKNELEMQFYGKLACSNCSSRFKALGSCHHVKDDTIMTSSCSLCNLLKSRSHKTSLGFDWLMKCESHWAPPSTAKSTRNRMESHPILLSTPEVLAFRGHNQRLRFWLSHLQKLAEKNPTKLPSIDPNLIDSLPSSLKTFIQSKTKSIHPAPNLGDGDDKDAEHQLRMGLTSCHAIFLSMNFHLQPCVDLIESLLS